MIRLPRFIIINKARPLFALGLPVFLWVVSQSFLSGSDIPDEILFNRDVRPFMSNTCFKCHGADVKAIEADLRLDLPEEAYRGRVGENGKEITPIVPGHPEKSEAWRRISTKDKDDVMPPVENLHQLTERDKAIFKRWIEQGAEYQSHWAYITPERVDPPDVKNNTAARNAIDHFILAQLDKRSIEPSPEADRATLIRRLSLDLIGLPPTPKEVDEFLKDTSEDAYEKVVDRLLASPHFGERMAVPWLDVVRFADSVGFHGDQLLNIFPYRDYVINAFNQNKPYDEFVTEQIAGDLLPSPSVEQLVATGFNRLNMVTREGGAQAKEYLAKYAADRVRAVSTAFLGSTMACAECHDHKFDPFSTKDFYSMAAFFADVKQYGVYSDYKYTPEPELVGWNNDFPFPPEIEVKSSYLVRRKARLEKEFKELVDAEAKALLADSYKQPGFNHWVEEVRSFLVRHSDGWETLQPDNIDTKATTETSVLEDQSVLFLNGEKFSDKNEEYLLEFASTPGSIGTLKLEILPDQAHHGNIFRGLEIQTHAGKPSSVPRLTVGVEWQIRRAGKDQPKEIGIASAYANLVSENYFNGYIQTSIGSEFVSSRQHTKDAYELHYFLKTPVELNAGDELMVKLKSQHLGKVRVSVSPFGLIQPGHSIDTEMVAAFTTVDPDKTQILQRAKSFIQSHDWHGSAYTELLKLYASIAECRDGQAFTAITKSTDPLTTRVLHRGDWKDETGEIVEPSPPEFLLGETPLLESQRLSRLDLAHWMTSPDNPLTSRAYVNRLWAQFFGSGLSAVVDDLGNQGEWPSHPDLLDWLSVEFVESGWDVKHMVKVMVSSASYRQSSRVRPALTDIDPNNRLLARQNPRRLEAEFVRDNALFIAGLIDPEIGGPSARPYQPAGYYEPLNFPVREYENDSDDRQYRRGVYSHWQRSYLHPMLANFDAPAREECTAQRTVSNTPQQALTLLNDPSFVEAARVTAQSLLSTTAGSGDFAAGLNQLYKKALARSPSEKEVKSLTEFFKARLAYYQEEPEEAEAFLLTGNAPVSDDLDSVELAAWSAVTRVILNLNETITRY
jgi:hypothetical protein